MQYKIDTKAFHEAFKEPRDIFFKTWVCPIHGARDYCSHYTEAFAEFKSKFMKKFIEPYTPQPLKPIGIHIAKKLVAPVGYEYGWKTVYRIVEKFRTGTPDCDVNAVRRRIVDFEFDKDALLGLCADGWMALGYIDESYHIPRNSDGFYADGDAVLCMRIKHAGKPWDSVSGTIADRAANNGVEGNHKTADIGEIYPLAQVVPEGCPTPDGTADIERDIANNFETLIDDTHYSMGNRHYKMPAEQNDLGHSPELEKAVVEDAKKHIVPGWEDNEANRIARKAVDNMNRLEKLGLSKQGETVDPRNVMLTEDSIEQLIASLREPRKSAGEIMAGQIADEMSRQLSNRKTTEDAADELSLIFETVTADPVPVAIATEFKGFDFEKINKDEDKKLNHLRYIAYLKSINSKQREGFSFDEAYDMAGKDYPEFHSEDPVPVEATTPEPKAYTYSGCDAEVWAPIMENMESNIAKANALEKVKESFPLDALTLIMGYHFGKHTADEMNDKRLEFIEKYRSLITDMGYSRF